RLPRVRQTPKATIKINVPDRIIQSKVPIPISGVCDHDIVEYQDIQDVEQDHQGVGPLPHHFFFHFIF
ncbi:hypothetical protein, partial [Psychroserpens mesophilus]|uniref:hypothetical protein n=1 Tax=Psychroserpens mesophilus TaxID=325473 RepID=UPI003D645A49